MQAAGWPLALSTGRCVNGPAAAACSYGPGSRILIWAGCPACSPGRIRARACRRGVGAVRPEPFPVRRARLRSACPNAMAPFSVHVRRGGRPADVLGSAAGPCEQADGPGTLHGLVAAVHAELAVQVPHVGLDRFGGAVPGLAFAQPERHADQARRQHDRAWPTRGRARGRARRHSNRRARRPRSLPAAKPPPPTADGPWVPGRRGQARARAASPAGCAPGAVTLRGPHRNHRGPPPARREKDSDSSPRGSALRSSDAVPPPRSRPHAARSGCLPCRLTRMHNLIPSWLADRTGCMPRGRDEHRNRAPLCSGSQQLYADIVAPGAPRRNLPLASASRATAWPGRRVIRTAAVGAPRVRSA